MDARPRLASAGPSDLAEALVRAATLVREGILAFLEGNPFRGRRVQEQARALSTALEAWRDTGSNDGGAVGHQALLASHAAAMAGAAGQLAGLAESRPSSRVPRELRDGVQEVAGLVEALLDEVLQGGGRDPAKALEAVRAGRRRFLDQTSADANLTALPFASRLLAIAAVQRLQEAAEGAAAAALLLPQIVEPGDELFITSSEML